MSRAPDDSLKCRRKARLAAHIWWSFAPRVPLLRREPLPEVVRRLGADGVAWWPPSAAADVAARRALLRIGRGGLAV